MEAIIIVIFSFILLSCILAATPFSGPCFRLSDVFRLRPPQGHTPVQVLTMSGRGIRTIKNILFIFILIGMITAVWRACGTIPFIIYHMSGLLIPSVFILIVFLLCCFVSLLTGTSFGTAATIGIICMSIAKANGIDPTFTGGAILSGIYFGDRCSPMSTSAILISELTQTDIYCNIKNMFKSALLPFSVTCLLYACWDFPVPATPAQPTCTHSFRKLRSALDYHYSSAADHRSFIVQVQCQADDGSQHHYRQSALPFPSGYHSRPTWLDHVLRLLPC